jgi:hypothetical protein
LKVKKNKMGELYYRKKKEREEKLKWDDLKQAMKMEEEAMKMGEEFIEKKKGNLGV